MSVVGLVGDTNLALLARFKPFEEDREERESALMFEKDIAV